MSFNKLALPPRGLVGLVAGMTIVPLALLSWFGWRTLEQDRLLEAQQIGQQLELAADLLSGALQQALSADAQRLVAGAREWPDGAVAVSYHDGVAEASPRQRLAYLPAVPALREADAGTFAEGEDLEFRRADHASAARVFRAQAASADPAVRAGALLRLGRNLRALGRTQEALDVYAQLSEIDGVGAVGIPAGLAGRYGRATLLEQEQRTAEIRAEGQRLDSDLRSGRWMLTRPVYALYAADAARWCGAASQSGEREEEAFAAAAESLWQRRASLPPTGQATLTAGAQRVTVLWQGSAGALHALIAGPRYAESRWFAAAAPLAKEHGVRFELRDSLGGRAFGSLGIDTPVTATRRTADTGLPWDLAVADAGSRDLRAAFGQRRQLLVTGFALVVLLSLAASILILRAVSRELAVAQLKSDFVSAVSHEFRTPLTSLRQFTDMLRENEHLGDDRRRVCYDAQARATDRLTRLVESLLDFGRMEAGARQYRFERCDGAALVRRVVDDFRPEVQASGHNVTCHEHGPIPIDADGEALSRALWNLLDNAVKYSPGSRTIDVHIERRGSDAAIAVRDHGIGIPADERAAILTKFHRGEQAQRLGIKGTGIGLAIVDQIVAAHGGRLEVASEPGAGSTFTIVLPVKE